MPGRDVVVIKSIYLLVQVPKNLRDGARFNFLRRGLTAELGLRAFGAFFPYGHKQNEKYERKRGSGSEEHGRTADLSGGKETFWIGRNYGVGVAHYIFWLKALRRGGCPIYFW
ncbi:hypothetical protein BSZ35_17915 [Salinibacter sp. 10B]|nr:hypothetical protein BSZ35_17915 [Salinibacter sp. 10B]